MAGTGFPGSGGDGLPGPETLLMLPTNAVMDSSTGDIYIADYGNYAVKVVYGNTGMRKVTKDLINQKSVQFLTSSS